MMLVFLPSPSLVFVRSAFRSRNTEISRFESLVLVLLLRRSGKLQCVHPARPPFAPVLNFEVEKGGGGRERVLKNFSTFVGGGGGDESFRNVLPLPPKVFYCKALISKGGGWRRIITAPSIPSRR